MQTTPAVVSSGDQGNEVIVRGGNPSENLFPNTPKECPPRPADDWLTTSATMPSGIRTICGLMCAGTTSFCCAVGRPAGIWRYGTCWTARASGLTAIRIARLSISLDSDPLPAWSSSSRYCGWGAAAAPQPPGALADVGYGLGGPMLNTWERMASSTAWLSPRAFHLSTRTAASFASDGPDICCRVSRQSSRPNAR